MNQPTASTVLHATLTRRELMFLYAWIFSSAPPNVGMSRIFDQLLDKFTKLGMAMADDGNSVTAPSLAQDVEVEFTRQELHAIRHILAGRLTPGSREQIPHGLARTLGWPLAESLSLARGLRKDMNERGGNPEADFKLDSELPAEDGPDNATCQT